MSVSSILLFVGATTLVAAFVTLCAFRLNSAKLERGIKRRSRTLEGPVAGHRSLSSIGLNADAARGRYHVPTSEGPHYSSVAAALRKGSTQQDKPSASVTAETASPMKETKLNSLQMIQARSAVLQSDGHQDKPAMSRLSMLARAAGERQTGPDISDEDEQGLVARRPEEGVEKAGGTNPISSPSALGMYPVVQTVAPKTPASERAKRGGVQTRRIESANAVSHPVSSDKITDVASGESLGAQQSSAVRAPIGQTDGLPDMFAWLGEVEMPADGLVDDLSDIDGGGLPCAARKSPQKSRR